MRCRSALLPIVVAALLVAGCSRPQSPSQASGERERFAAMFARGYVPGRSGQLFIVPDSGYFFSGDHLHPYMHGTPWPCDTRIPLLFFGAPFVHAGSYPDSVSLQSVAPTLLAMVHDTTPSVMSRMTGTKLADAIANTARKPAAVVLIVLDGMGRATWDSLEDSLPTLARLRHEGAWFENAALDYLPTATGVSHATVSTGTDPRIHGIQGNSIFKNGREVEMYAKTLMHPDSIRVATLADEWAQRFKGANIVVHGTSSRATVGLAGHGACAPGGRKITVAMLDETNQGWFSNDTCYRKVPDYLVADTRWASYRAHALPDTSWGLFLRTPWLVDLEEEALLDLIANEHIGQDSIPDLLLINLKTPDYVAHRYGPFSPESDTALHHLDRALAHIVAKLESVTKARGGFVLAVTADHGMPTRLAPGEQAFTGRSVCGSLRAHFAVDSTVVLPYYDASTHQVYVDRAALEARHHTLGELGHYLETLETTHVLYAFTEDEIRKVRL